MVDGSTCLVDKGDFGHLGHVSQFFGAVLVFYFHHLLLGIGRAEAYSGDEYCVKYLVHCVLEYDFECCFIDCNDVDALVEFRATDTERLGDRGIEHTTSVKRVD